ncbi:MAG: hypothetical protein QOH31_4433 [Verrucomicrobiota bacterium]|jgi:hypothetical protein
MSPEEAFIPPNDRPSTNILVGVFSIKANALKPLPTGKLSDLTFEELLGVLEDVEFSVYHTPKQGN